MEKEAKIYVAGHNGMVGRAITRALRKHGFDNLLLRTHGELDLKAQKAVEDFFASEKPEYVFLAAAKVGGIGANIARPAEFLADNLKIQTNVIDSAWKNGAKKLLFLGTSCIYPKLHHKKLVEEDLLSAPLEPTNASYAIAKIAGIRMCQSYRQQYGFDAISLMPPNLYGPYDNFDPENSHVLPALIRRFHEAKLANKPYVVIWGTGAPTREFMHVDDLGEACVYFMENYSDSPHLNVGNGEEMSILNIARLIAEIVGYRGEIRLDASKPDGTPGKTMDSSRALALGWRPQIDFKSGVAHTYEWFCKSLIDKQEIRL